MPRIALLLLWSLALTACPKEIIFEVTGTEGSSSTGPAATSTSTVPTTGVDTSSSGDATTAIVTTGSSSGETSGGESGSTSSGMADTSTDTTLVATSEGSDDSSSGEPGAWFDCYGCLCDADLFYCQQVFDGLKDLPPKHCPVVRPDTLDSGCVMFPQECGVTPTCDCLPKMDGGCFCTEVEPGVFEVVCPLP
jgi:hypothetical protein